MSEYIKEHYRDQRYMPEQKPGYSEQTVQTPAEFLEAVEKRFDETIGWDLAANKDNCVTDELHYYGPGSLVDDAFDVRACWNQDVLYWCNPPFAKLKKWVRKANESTGRILMLVPAAVGSNWWCDFVHDKAYEIMIQPRITFIGHAHPYPKDLALLCYNFGKTGREYWRWQPLKQKGRK